MMKKKLGALVALVLLFSVGVSAQRTTTLKLNEVLVVNNDNYQDNYGSKSPWIEIFNNSAGSVDLKGCFLTTDKNNPTMYMIPKGDVQTKVRPYQHMLFWADAKPGRGTFHTNFTFDPNKANYLALYDSDGRTLIDEVTIPASQTPDVSYGLVEDGVSDWVVLSNITPSTNNRTLDSNAKIENFKRNDPTGFGMTLTAMMVVFLGLFILFAVFKLVGKIAVGITKRNAQKQAKATGTEVSNAGEEAGEVFAAIGMALHEFTNNMHDDESTILTIRKVQRNYSPWSSKIQSLRETPKRK